MELWPRVYAHRLAGLSGEELDRELVRQVPERMRGYVYYLVTSYIPDLKVRAEIADRAVRAAQADPIARARALERRAKARTE